MLIRWIITFTLLLDTRVLDDRFFAQGQAHRYKSKTDKQLLLPVQRGGAKCNDDSTCGGGADVPAGYASVRGSCVKGLCQCSEIYTGPFCQVCYNS